MIERHAQTAKTLLMKLLKGNLGSWDLIAPLAAHYLNSRIASPTLSAPDTYYFLQKARSQVSEVLPDVVPFEDLELQIDELARVVFPAMAARAKLSADKKAFSINQARNMARRLQVNDIVMMKALNRQSKQDERWEGLFKIVSAESNGYIIMNDLGEIRSHPVPRSCLRKIRSRDESKGGWWEVTKIVDHRNGADGSVEYNTFFAGYDDPFWIHKTNFNSKNIISAYWKAQGKTTVTKSPLPLPVPLPTVISPREWA